MSLYLLIETAVQNPLKRLRWSNTKQVLLPDWTRSPQQLLFAKAVPVDKTQLELE